VKSYLIQFTAFNGRVESDGEKKGELKNAGISHDVAENKRRKMSPRRDPIMFMKTNNLSD
jgi:hypothetical protein